MNRVWDLLYETFSFVSVTLGMQAWSAVNSHLTLVGVSHSGPADIALSQTFMTTLLEDMATVIKLCSPRMLGKLSIEINTLPCIHSFSAIMF